ncbi:c-type cytochrome [Stagnihabitans tardus]|uniref:C-type cytochrome n=1 Tax=Stagnihabitans tardus TaxID=2699202 RepID=A0AAE5BUG1_9RHOB|nr:cytochrome c family protein [Stagnihabitans tardus]NBZ86749.1 c-type cytochrome [Stagnihabitans tardus]
MFDTMTMTKIVGAVCGALLFFLFGAWAASSIYGLGEAGHGEHAKAVYPAAVEAEEAPAEEAAVKVAYADVAGAADAAAGEKVFGKCKSCHKIDGTDGTGPHLNGVVGRQPGAAAGYGYSDAMKAVTEAWTPEHLYAFLENPKKVVVGTKMGFAGLPKPEDRANLIAYLETLK